MPLHDHDNLEDKLIYLVDIFMFSEVYRFTDYIINLDLNFCIVCWNNCALLCYILSVCHSSFYAQGY